MALALACGQAAPEAEAEAEADPEADQDQDPDPDQDQDPDPDPDQDPDPDPDQDPDPELRFETRALRLDAPSHRAPAGAPHAIVVAPTGRSPEAIFVFLHGWSGCVRVLANEGFVTCAEGESARRRRRGWGLAPLFASAERPVALVFAQLLYNRRHAGAAGQFTEEGFAAGWLEALALPDDVPVVLLAHSAGFETALAWLRRGGLDERLRGVVLFDALYAGTERFAGWAQDVPADDPRARHLWSFHLGRGSTGRQNARLLGIAGSDPRITVAESPVSHGDVPAHHLVEVVRAEHRRLTLSNPHDLR